jgi:hypothetical protein
MLRLVSSPTQTDVENMLEIERAVLHAILLGECELVIQWRGEEFVYTAIEEMQKWNIS